MKVLRWTLAGLLLTAGILITNYGYSVSKGPLTCSATVTQKQSYITAKAKAHATRASYTDQTNDQPSDQSTELIGQMKSEIEHLRRQLDTKDTNIDQLNKILAMQTMQNTKLVEQLEAPPQTFYTKITELVGKIKNGKVRNHEKETKQVPPTHRTGTP